MTWIDSNGDVRPQSWEEYCAMSDSLPAWAFPVHSYQPVQPPVKPDRDRERVPRMRQRLFRANPHCFWCGCKVFLNIKHASPTLATVDHLYSRLHPKRTDSRRRQESVLHVLACYACNHERGLCEQQQRPFVPRLKERLEHARLADATLAKNAASRAKGKQKQRAICTFKEAVEFARENPSR